MPVNVSPTCEPEPRNVKSRTTHGCAEEFSAGTETPILPADVVRVSFAAHSQ